MNNETNTSDKKWTQASLELKKALDDWQNHTEKQSQRLNPDEQMLADMQRLIIEIKAKLNNLENSNENKECSNVQNLNLHHRLTRIIPSKS